MTTSVRQNTLIPAKQHKKAWLIRIQDATGLFVLMRKQLRHAADYQAIRMRIDVCHRRRNLNNGPIYIQILYCVQTLQAVPRLAK